MCHKVSSFNMTVHLTEHIRQNLLYVFFRVIPRRLNFICQRFRTLCLFHLHRQVGVEFYTYLHLFILHLPAYGGGTECSKTSAYKIQTPGNYPEENIQHTEHGESSKSDKSCCTHFTENFLDCAPNFLGC